MKPSNTNLKLHVIKHEIMTLLQQQNEGTKAFIMSMKQEKLVCTEQDKDLVP